MKISKLLEHYMQRHAEDRIVSVLRTRSCVKALNKNLGHLDHAKLSPAAVRSYRAGDGLAIATLNRELGVLRAALHFAVKEGLIRNALPIPKRAGAAKRVIWLSPTEWHALIAEAERRSESIAGVVMMIFLTGQRLGAVLSLRWSQVDRENGVIWFTDSELLHAQRRKGRGTVPISPGLSRLLDKLREGNTSPFVLTNRYGDRHRDINREQWRDIVTAAGMPALTPHGLRHAVATGLIRKGESLLNVSRLLGHSSTKITEEVYVNFQPQFLQNTVNMLDDLTGKAA